MGSRELNLRILKQAMLDAAGENPKHRRDTIEWVLNAEHVPLCQALGLNEKSVAEMVYIIVAHRGDKKKLARLIFRQLVSLMSDER